MTPPQMTLRTDSCVGLQSSGLVGVTFFLSLSKDEFRIFALREPESLIHTQSCIKE